MIKHRWRWKVLRLKRLEVNQQWWAWQRWPEVISTIFALCQMIGARLAAFGVIVNLKYLIPNPFTSLIPAAHSSGNRKHHKTSRMSPHVTVALIFFIFTFWAILFRPSKHHRPKRPAYSPTTHVTIHHHAIWGHEVSFSGIFGSSGVDPYGLALSRA